MRKLLTALGFGALVASEFKTAEAWHPMFTVVSPTGAKVGVERFFDNRLPPPGIAAALSSCGTVLLGDSVTGAEIGPSPLCPDQSNAARLRMVSDQAVSSDFINCAIEAIKPICEAQVAQGIQAKGKFLATLGGIGLGALAAGTALTIFCQSRRRAAPVAEVAQPLVAAAAQDQAVEMVETGTPSLVSVASGMTKT